MKTVGLCFPTEEKTFACPFCDKTYKTEEGLKKHIAEKHPEHVGDKE